MQEGLLQPLQLPAPPFSEFLAALFQSLDREGVRYCVLRNYEGFPSANLGGDLDFLILRAELPRAMRALQSIQGVRVVGYDERFEIVSVYLEGASATPGCRSFQVDFFFILGWKGLPYLHADAVLRASVPRQAGNLNFFVPSPVHEAITSLFNSLVHSACLKEKYFPQAQRTFASHRPEVIAAFSLQFGQKVATRLVDAVVDGDKRKVTDCISPLRSALALRSLLHRPVRSVAATARHHAREIVLRISPENLETVCVFGPGGGGKSTLIEGLMPILQSAAKFVQKHHCGPQLSLGSISRGITASADSNAETPRGSLISMTRIALWLVEEWLCLFIGTKVLTLRIADGSYADLLTDPKGQGYGGPMWFARLAGKLFPSPELWILLDPNPEGLQSRDQEALSTEALRQLEVCRAFVKTRKSYVILDASKPAQSVTEEAYAAIIDTLAQRAERQLKRRF
jgi:energy-coupling factor transporter ATP-binding protein EcfA2